MHRLLEESTVNDRPGFAAAWQSLRCEPTYVILGVQGSGTNLLCRILQDVFDISVTRDRSLICAAGVRVAGREDPGSISREMQRVWRSVFPNPLRRRFLARAYYHQAENYLGVEEAIGRIEIGSAADFTNFWYSYHAFRNGARRKGVKSDDIWRYVEQFDTVIPERRYIRLLRDPRDNALSIASKDWGPCNVLCAAQFVKHQARIYDKETTSHPEVSLVARYEDLLSSPELFIHRFAEQFDVALCDDWKDRLVKIGIRPGNRKKWERLSPDTLRFLEQRLQNLLEAHGYGVAASPGSQPGVWRKMSWLFDDTLRRVPQKAGKMWGRRVLAR